MIQYLYFHTGSEYISKLSIDRTEYYYSDREKLFETARQATEGNTFTYAPLGNNEVLFMQSSKDDNGLCVIGLRGSADSVLHVPAAYINKLEKKPSHLYLKSEKLHEGNLPLIGSQDSFSLAKDLHHIFPKLIDILLFGDVNKKIAIIAETASQGMKYIKVLSMFLPLAFMKKIGFCVGSTKIPDEDYSIMKNDGNTESLSIRIWLSESKNNNYNSLSSYCYVFDTNAQIGKCQDNYKEELSVTAKVLDEINLCDQTKAKMFSDAIAKAFDSQGNFDVEALKKYSTLLMFELNQNANSAKEILDMGFAGDNKQQLLFIRAAQVLLRTENIQYLSSQDKNAIVLGYKNNNQIAQELEDPLFDYLSSTYTSLGQDEKILLGEIVCNDTSGERLNTMLAKIRKSDYKEIIVAFDFSIQILDVALKRSLNNLYSLKNLIKTIVEFFDIDNFFRIIPQSQLLSGEELFDIIPQYESSELRQLMTAILLSSAYKTSTPEAYCEMRLRGFKKMLPFIADGHINQFEFILAVRYKILEIFDILPELNDRTKFDFLFNIEYGEKFVSEFIANLSFEETLESEKLLKNRTSQQMYYERMSTAIIAKLLDVDYAMNQIKCGSNLYYRYVDFFGTLPQEKRVETAEINKYLDELKHESNINEKFAKYRYDFTHECYRTFSAENKKQVQHDNTSIKTYEEIPEMAEKLRIVETTMRVFASIKGHKIKCTQSYCGVFIWAFAFSLLSMLILSFPAIIYPASLGTFDFAHILGKFQYYFKTYLFALPIYVFLLEVVSYFVLKRGNKLKRASIITILCGIIPIVCFTLSCILFYFIRIDLPFNL